MATRPRADSRRRIGDLAGSIAVILGLAFLFTRSCEAERMSMNRPGGSGNILEEMFKVVGRAMVDSVMMTVEELTEDGKRAREQTAAAEQLQSIPAARGLESAFHPQQTLAARVGEGRFA